MKNTLFDTVESMYPHIMQLALLAIVVFWLAGEVPLFPPVVWFFALVLAHTLGVQNWSLIYQRAKGTDNIDWIITYWFTVAIAGMFLSFPPDLGYLVIMLFLYMVLYLSPFLIKYQIIYLPEILTK